MDFISAIVGFMLGAISMVLILAFLMNSKDTTDSDSKTSGKILYICDRKSEYCCNGSEECNRKYCKYTTDIDHAANFKKLDQEYLAYIEEDR